ncbi:MAG: rRNA pseudouridine synthase [Clostridiales bacterium]|nr:rRNA pseudouridine synthase [Clostridiales bacterium]
METLKKMRLDRFLSNAGIGSRKEVKALIKGQRVLVDNSIINDPGYIIEPTKAEVMVDNQPVTYKKFHYLMLNKPAGVISATRDNLHQTVVDLLPSQYKHLDLFPVGRLDRDTEGLLIMTNDGQLAHRILSPKNKVPKIYYAVIEGKVTFEDVDVFQKGIKLNENFTTLPAQLTILKSCHRSEVHVTVFEGKFHQVKRMFEAVGKKVVYLKRICMGNLYLDEKLAPGQIRELAKHELDLLNMAAHTSDQ